MFVYGFTTLPLVYARERARHVRELASFWSEAGVHHEIVLASTRHDALIQYGFHRCDGIRRYRLDTTGDSNVEIAERLVLSVRTVERHATNLYAKIGARGAADATAYALRHHLA